MIRNFFTRTWLLRIWFTEDLITENWNLFYNSLASLSLTPIGAANCVKQLIVVFLILHREIILIFIGNSFVHFVMLVVGPMLRKSTCGYRNSDGGGGGGFRFVRLWLNAHVVIHGKLLTLHNRGPSVAMFEHEWFAASFDRFAQWTTRWNRLI